MFKTLEIHNFRKVEFDTMVFTKGLNVIRGANEASKSTRIEAALYALFGSKSLRQPLEETVTWGKDPKQLRVILTVEDQSGQEFTFTRHKGGAEVQKNGQVFITGQNEVTTFAATLLGADAKTAGNLMLSSQKGLRGVLEEGPKATGEIISSLADFDLFDRILEAATEKLALGSTAPLQQRVDTLMEHLNGMGEVVQPDEAKHVAAKGHLSAEIAKLDQALSSALRPAFLTERALWETATASRAKVQSLEQARDQALARAKAAQERADAVADLAMTVLPDTSALEQQLREAQTTEERRTKFELFSALPVVTKGVNRAEWLAEVTRTENLAIKSRTDASMLTSDVRVLKAKMIEATVCGLCGKDVSELPEVKVKNDAILAQVAELEAKAKALIDKAVEAEAQLKSVPGVKAVDEKIMKGVRSLGDLVSVDDSVIPAIVTWVGPAVGEAVSVDGIQQKLKELRAYQKRILAAVGERDAHLATNLAEKKQAEALQVEIDGVATVDDVTFVKIEQSFREAADLVTEAEQRISALKGEIQTLDDTFTRALQEYQRSAQVRDQVLAQVEQTKKDIAQTEFNNNLVKKVRAARPIVTNKLWNIVLTSVTQQFSKMRGVSSIVTRSSNGFLVNGKGIDGLSGSALDLLGLAVRSALVRTFIPGCSMMVLDEPAAACDDNRSISLLSFIAASNFDQTILITHEDVSESFAANLIQL